MPIYNEYQKTGNLNLSHIPVVGKFLGGDSVPDIGGAISSLGGNSSNSPGAGIHGAKEAMAVLNKLPVKGKAAKTGYSRDRFGPAWTDKAKGVLWAGNGCDTRNDILKRDLKNPTLSGKCKVMSGVLNPDPYTGKVIHFKRGKESAKIQIDHLIPLGNAWVTGAQQLPESKRVALANDPRNLLAVDGPANGAKGDRDASGWMPPNRKIWCQYIEAQINVKHIYGLWVTSAEKNAMMKVLSRCPQ